MLELYAIYEYVSILADMIFTICLLALPEGFEPPTPHLCSVRL